MPSAPGPLGSFGWHLLVFGLAFLVSAGVTAWGLRNRDKQAADLFVAFAATTAGLNLAVLAKVLVPLPYVWPIHLVEQAFAVLVAMTWFYFTASYAGYRSLLERPSARAIVGLAVGVMVLFESVPPFANLSHGPGTAVTTPFPSVAYADTAITSAIEMAALVFVAVGSFALVYRLVSAGYVRTWQTVAVLSTVVGTMFFELFEDELIAVVPGVDYAAPVTTLVGVVYVVALYRYDVLGHRPVAKSEAIEAIDDPVYVLDPGGAVVAANDAAVEFADGDLSPGDAAGDVLPEAVANTDLVRESREGYEEVEVRDGDRTCYFDVHTGTVESLGESSGLTVALRDITDLRERERDLQRQTEQLDQFASVVSHDLRNPLSIARDYLEEVDADDEKPVEVVEDSLDRMDRMIEDALTLAREGRAIEDKERISLTGAASEAWTLSETADASIELDLTDGVTVAADESRLQTLFENLFRNAAEHAGETATVEVGLLREDGDPVGFYVEDDGPGIPEDNREAVFDQGFTTAAGGTGFGLAIVDSVAAAHDWEVTATESEDGGARFEVRGVDSLRAEREAGAADAAAAES